MGTFRWGGEHVRKQSMVEISVISHLSFSCRRILMIFFGFSSSIFIVTITSLLTILYSVLL